MLFRKQKAPEKTAVEKQGHAQVGFHHERQVNLRVIYQATNDAWYQREAGGCRVRKKVPRRQLAGAVFVDTRFCIAVEAVNAEV